MRERVARRRRALAACLLVALAAALASGCGGGRGGGASSATKTTHTTAVDPAVQARLMASGQKVFAKHCALCHTLGGKVSHPSFVESPIPNLNEVKPKLAYIEQRVMSGGIDMPSLSNELSKAQFKAVVAYVAGTAGSDVHVGAGGGDATAGEQVFRSNCQRCHSIAGRPVTGRPPYPGTDLNQVKPSEALVEHQVRTGISEEMPSFRRILSAQQIADVAAYVTATAGR